MTWQLYNTDAYYCVWVKLLIIKTDNESHIFNSTPIIVSAYVLKHDINNKIQRCMSAK
jgi:hypothetical protein